ncbi:hypothetical protein BA190_22060 [Labrys sp. WJW]|uniref:DUF1062 domain-containing protein n=1 Tax=Labrys sp. WJW TaxID=1737983 RepID=UPI00082B78A4|nr:DUF1062 domain-containing protein [Labrys sp. WJW]OCC02685.1 hypothetical protein BA190_22060 [Labrys sp. WJW]
MCNLLKVRWTITPQIPPQPWLACAGCGIARPFRSSGKARLNANGRRLDAWLIYKCTVCDKTWNRPLFERRPVQDIPPDVLAALQANESAWIRRQAFDLTALRSHAFHIEESTEIDIDRQVLERADDWSILLVELVVDLPVGIRLDRLLARELNLSRTRLQSNHRQGRLRLDHSHPEALRRRVTDGTCVRLDLGDEANRAMIGNAAAGGSGPSRIPCSPPAGSLERAPR